MKKSTLFLLALGGAVLATSLTLNVCFYQQFDQARKHAAAEKYKNRRKAVSPKKAVDAKKKAEKVQPEPLMLASTGHYRHHTIYARFSRSGLELVNLSPELISISPSLPFTLESESYGDHIMIKADFQPETAYKVVIRKGLEDSDGGKLEYDARFQVRFPIREPSIKALSAGQVFPVGRTNRTLPLELCNLKEIEITVRKLYENNLLRYSTVREYSWQNIAALNYGKKTASKKIKISIPRNKEVNYALDLNQLPTDWKPGVYGLSLIALDLDGSRTGDVQLVVNVTDLAPQSVLDHRNHQAFIAVRRISDGSACAGAQVTLVSHKHQVLASGVTDAAGLVRLDYSRSPAGTDPEDYPDALLVKSGNDLVFQRELFHRGHSLAEFESDGNPVTGEPRALVHTDRGVYRPGEKVFVTAWVRNPELKVLAGVPCQLQVRDQNYNVIYTRKVKTGPAGEVQESFLLPEDLPSGRCTVQCQPEDDSNAWGDTSFLAADFMPDRIKVKLEPSAAERFRDRDEKAQFTVSAEYYFGGKLDKAPYHFTVTPELSGTLPPAWKDWNVGSREFSAGKGFSRHGKLPDGPLTIDYPGFSELNGKAWHPVALRAAARVSEPGGRAVTANATVIHHPTPFYLGLRQQSENDSVVLEWKFFPANPKFAAARPSDKIELSIFRIEWKYVLKKRGGRDGQLSREWVREKVPCGKEIIDPASNPKCVWRKKMQSGGYEIIARCGDMRTDLNFWHWYGEGGARSANPSVISCTTDKECYLPGETAKITLHSRHAGTAVIAVGDLKLAGFRSYPVKPGRNELAVALPADAMTAACYAGITLVSGEERQFGLVRFKLDQNRHRLAVALTAPENATPQEKIKVKIALTTPDGKPQNGTVQLYAVDEGILSLTGYRVPDIFQYFYGGSCCDFVFTDIYSLLYPDLKIGPDGKIGGDGAPEAAAKMAKRPNGRESAPESAVIVLPPTAVNGSGEFEIALPDHLGALRLMAVASAPERVGSADRVLKMRDKIDLLVTAPQVCAPGDEAAVTFNMFNHDQPAGKMELKVDIPGIAAEVRVVGKGKNLPMQYLIRIPDREGVFTFTATLKKDNIVKRKTVKIPVRLPNPATVHTVFHTLKPGEKWTSDKKGIPAFASDAKYSLTLSGSCAGALKDAVGWLNEYPYGCLEQTVSGAFPFLAVDALEKCGVLSAGEAATAKVKLNLTGAKILSMMLYNGAFPMWQGGTEEWSAGTAYAAHFLTAGGLLRDNRQKKLLAGYLKGRMQDASAPRYERAYAAYVLALMKESRQETAAGARNLLKTPQDDFAAFLATAALLESGFSGEAWPHLNRLLSKEIWRTDNSTPHFVRPAARAGMTLYILMKLRTDAPETIAKLRQTLLNEIKPDGSGWGVTHDNAWAVLGLAELERVSGTEKSAAAVTLPDGGKRQAEPAKNPSFKLKNAAPVTVENTGNTPVYVQYRVRGVPVKAEPVRGALRLRREILHGGKAVDSARQGDLLTVRIRLESSGSVKDVVLSDLLPGGLEIEDERFATRARSTGTRPGDRQKNLTVKQVEKRPGEFVLSGDLRRGTAEITYQVRAVSRGKFTSGSTAAEAMYDPATRAFEPSAGSFEVK